jgi:hypothetical protein
LEPTASDRVVWEHAVGDARVVRIDGTNAEQMAISDYNG